MKNSTKLIGVLLLLLVVALLYAPQVARSHDAGSEEQSQQIPQAHHPLLQTERGQFALKATRTHCQVWNIDPRTLPESSPIEVAIKQALVAERL